MKKIALLIIFSTIILTGCNNQSQNKQNILTSENSNIPEKVFVTPEEVDFTANFEIYTNGTKRIFSPAMYHNQSLDVYIEATDPSIIHVKKSEVTWKDFFDTLPFSITKECLITGTKQTFCSSKTSKLQFFINEQETPDALDLTIKANDTLKIIYK